MKVELVKPQGYCGGVVNAIKMAYLARKENPDQEVYVLGALVHNQTVIDELEKSNIHTILEKDINNKIEELPKGTVVIFTAHGHDEKLENRVKVLGLKIYDATCPHVVANANKIKEELKAGHQVIYIGQSGHKETEAVLSISKDISLYDIKLLINYYLITDESPFVINQTTLNFLSLKDIHKDILEHIPGARIADEICVASRKRQEAILNIDNSFDLIIIVGDESSSNTRKLFEIAVSSHPQAKILFVHDLEALRKENIDGYKKAAISSGASTPSYVVDDIYNYLLSK
ncbi:MAG: 4-hydroxy-3-methylbut-2-enyl diphosphate reductase [Bacilli bacterium]|nr:4-hydroxy-3-methylbut-2-enyl diphosphate reductase [Bacilli bacterium]